MPMQSVLLLYLIVWTVSPVCHTVEMYFNGSMYQSISQSIYLHQTTWIHINMREKVKKEEKCTVCYLVGTDFIRW